MNTLTGFSAHLCDVVQKPRKRQKPIVTILVSERSNDRTRLGQFWSDHIFVIVRAKGLITLLLYCSKGKLCISLCKKIATHNFQLKCVLLAYDVTVFVLILELDIVLEWSFDLFCY